LLEFRAEDQGTGTDPLGLQIGGENQKGWKTVINEKIVKLKFSAE